MIELAIVLAVIGVLAVAVLTQRGMIESARTATASQLVDTVRRAARTYATRFNASRDFNGVSLAALKAAALLPDNVATPWQTDVDVGPSADVTRIQIGFCVPKRHVCDDLTTMLSETGAVTCDSDGSFGGSGVQFRIVTR